jgi:hypothetical protein
MVDHGEPLDARHTVAVLSVVARLAAAEGQEGGVKST